MLHPDWRNIIPDGLIPGAMIPSESVPMRLDRLLFFLRLAKSRTLAQKLIEAGGVRLDGERVTDCARKVDPGRVLTLVAHGQVRVVRIDRIPDRRGPPAEAASMISDIAPPQVIDAAARRF